MKCKNILNHNLAISFLYYHILLILVNITIILLLFRILQKLKLFFLPHLRKNSCLFQKKKRSSVCRSQQFLLLSLPFLSQKAVRVSSSFFHLKFSCGIATLWKINTRQDIHTSLPEKMEREREEDEMIRKTEKKKACWIWSFHSMQSLQNTVKSLYDMIKITEGGN